MISKIVYCFSFFTAFNFSIFAQSPSIQWQKCYGGTGSEISNSIQQTTDGGYIVIGSTSSNNSDVSGNHGGVDCWIIKLNNNGDISWQTCYGGTGDEVASVIQQTTDGGYIFAGYTNSNDGDVSGNHGTYDYWVVKLDSQGELLWQKSLGGSLQDQANSIQQTADGGYIIAGYTNSNDGDVSGNHGGQDCWIIKLNNSGDISWQKCYGGSVDDQAHSIKQTTDGGYIIAGFTLSNDGDISGNHGAGDYWVVKTDSNGDISWQKCYGGTDDELIWDIQQTSDGGYIVIGYSDSNNGDATSNHGSYDYWIVRIDNAGMIVWQASFGGSSFDLPYSVQETTNGNFIVAGQTWSGDGDITGYHGGSGDYWITEISSAGVLEWQKALGGTNSERAYCIRQTSDGGFIITGRTLSNNTGDVGPNQGNNDYWIVKLEPENPVPVMLTKLDALLQNKSILCKWQTLQELNSSHFVIERSNDAINYIDIGRVAASGNSFLPLNYSFTDSNLFSSGATYLYYRLRIVDVDASFNYSNTVKVSLKYTSVLNILPNPVNDHLVVEFISPINENAILLITDYTGRKLYQQYISIKKGSNSFPLNTGWLASGEYILSINGKNYYPGRFIKISY